MGESSRRHGADISDIILGRLLIMMILAWIVVAVQLGFIIYFLITKPGGPGVILPISCTWVLFALGSTYWFNFRRRWIDYVSQHGIAADGRIEALWESVDRGGNLPYARYSYSVGGQTYRSKQYYDPQQVSYEEGNSVNVLYDPRKPKRSVVP